MKDNRQALRECHLVEGHGDSMIIAECYHMNSPVIPVVVMCFHLVQVWADES